MAQIYTRKKDDFDKDEKTMNATEFINRMFSKAPEKTLKPENTESPK